MMNSTFMGILAIVTMVIWIMVSAELSKSPKKAGRKRKQPEKTNRTHVCWNVIHDSCRCLTHSEHPILKQTRKN